MKDLKTFQPIIEHLTFGGALLIFLFIPLNAFYFSHAPTQGSTPIEGLFGLFVPVWLVIALVYLFVKE